MAWKEQKFLLNNIMRIKTILTLILMIIPLNVYGNFLKLNTPAKQVILLSTDEEINQKYHKYIKPYLSRSYKVEYDQKINGSKLQEGYFF